MIKIAVCDDNKGHREAVGKMAGDILFSRTDSKIILYASGQELVDAIESGNFSCDLLILDINMKGLNGLDTARYIRDNQIDVDILFLTVSGDYVYDGYTFKAFAYLLKPVQRRKLEETLLRYMDEKENQEECLNIQVRGENVRIPLSNILYFESEVRKIHVHLRNERITFYGKLNELEQLISSKGFWRCHQSYLVNRRYIRSISREGVKMDSRMLPVSRKYWNEIRETL